MDGLLVKINDYFVNYLGRNGLEVKNLKIRLVSRDSSMRSQNFKGYKDLTSYKSSYSSILNSGSYLCSAGPFPVIENIELINNNIKFTNSYRWYNIGESRRLVKTVQYDSNRTENIADNISRYESLMTSSIDQYIKDVNAAISARLNTYMDPCYVDAGYVSP